MKRYLVLSVLLASSTLAATAADRVPDESFYHSLAQGGMAEVDLAQLAEQKSSDPKVKEFAARMVKDHSAANQGLESLAASKNIALPRSSSAGDLATKAKLEVLTGKSFDSSYITSQVKAHQQTVALLRKEIASGQDADAQAFARKVLPTVRSHLQQIRSIATEENVKT
jgi:putative membrane protein